MILRQTNHYPHLPLGGDKVGGLKITIFLMLISVATMGKVRTGIEVLKSMNYKPLEGLRVGLVTNPTGVDDNLVSTIDLLHQAANVNLVALYGPEHGVRGSAHAGNTVKDERDSRTGLPSYSLYGKNKTPSPEILRGIDILVYDIQDIGCRSFTYVSTLGNIIKAAARDGIRVMVLDRPNPLGGEKVEGCLVEDDCISFVSQYKIPYIYGLTAGEVAMLMNGEGMVGRKKCDLTVIKMEGWERSMTYEQTGLEWVLASPHIPEAVTAPFYAVSGIIGEVENLSIGVGYTLPFRLFGASWIDGAKLADRMNERGIPGVRFRPICYVPYYAVGVGKELQGVQVYFTDYSVAPLTDIQFLVAEELYHMYPSHDFLATTKHRQMIDKVCGSKQVMQRFMRRHRWEDARDYWYKDAEAFRKLSQKYYLY